MEKISLTGIRNLDIEILINISNESLPNICICNKYFLSLYKSDELWCRKLLKIITPNLLEFKIDDINYKDYYYFILYHPITFWDLIVAFGNTDMIDAVLKAGLIDPLASAEDYKKEWSTPNDKIIAKNRIKDIIRIYPNHPLTFRDKIVLEFSLYYGLLDEKEDNVDYNIYDANEATRSLVIDTNNYIFEWMLQHDIEIDTNYLEEMDRSTPEFKTKLKLLLEYNIEYDIELPSNILSILMINEELVQLVLDSGYIPNQDDIDYIITGDILCWYNVKDDIIPFLEFLQSYDCKISQEAFENYILEDYHDEYTVLIEFCIDQGLELDSDILIKFLDTLHHELIHGYDGCKGKCVRNIKNRLKYFFELLSIFEKYNIEIESIEIVDLAKKYRFDSIVSYFTEHYGIYPSENIKVSIEEYPYESKIIHF